MTNIDKAVKILKSINNVDVLPVHHRKIVAAVENALAKRKQR
jgi:hypothetical protein